MKIDLWYPGEKVAYVSYTFYPNDVIYRGNLYNADGKPIGDWSSRDSMEIERRFHRIFNGT